MNEENMKHPQKVFNQNQVKDDASTIVEVLNGDNEDGDKSIVNKVIGAYASKYIELRRPFILRKIELNLEVETSGFVISETEFEELIDYVDYIGEAEEVVDRERSDRENVSDMEDFINQKVLETVERANEMKQSIIDRRAMEEEEI